ncbi:E3 ubiquitin protein ligase BRE1-like protein 2 isoform X1 [Tanacetum coccineum]|uniref:E3 ubiquitin protein ligase n=1 Tax=Tanacetum coccineum TaxID=301880 RepID=A0ABQ4X1J3_9ASTR
MEPLSSPRRLTLDQLGVADILCPIVVPVKRDRSLMLDGGKQKGMPMTLLLLFRPSSYDDALITMNLLWSKLDDDLILLGARAGAGQSALEALQCADSSRESVALRHSSTLELMKLIEDTIQILMAKIESIVQSMNDNLSAEGWLDLATYYIQSNKIDDLMKEEVKHLQVVIDALHPPVPFAVNLSVSPESTVDKTMRLRDLKASIRSKILPYDRLFELHETQEENSTLLKQLEDLQNELKDNRCIYTSRPYILLKGAGRTPLNWETRSAIALGAAPKRNHLFACTTLNHFPRKHKIIKHFINHILRSSCQSLTLA